MPTTDAQKAPKRGFFMRSNQRPSPLGNNENHGSRRLSANTEGKFKDRCEHSKLIPD